MKKIFTLAAAILASMAMSASTIFGPFTLTAENNVKDQANAVEGGTATVTTVFPTGSSNELTIDDWTFYKFNSSSAVKCELAEEATFEVGDSIFVTVAANASSKKTCGVKLNNSINVVGEIPGGQYATFGYEVVAEDGIAGTNSFSVYRSSSDTKFGRVWVDREGATPSTDPVESAEISGETACVIGGSVELTCNAPKATTYQWYLGGAAIDGATAKKYSFAPTAAGEYSFTCAASNDYTATPVVAAAHVVTVTDPAAACGELINAVLNGGTSATMSGVLGGTFDTNLGSGKYKLDKNRYIGVQLASGTFLAGDVVTITMSAAGQNYPCLFADKDRNTCLFLATETSDATEYQITLPVAANGITAIYLSRGDESDGYKWNPTVSSISVSRSCEASSNAEIASLTINGEAVEAVEGVYSYTLGATVNLAAVEVVYTLAHPKASATPASGFMVDVPNASDPANTQVITVTAQDGSQATYTVSVAKSAQANNDATLSALSVDGYTLAPAFASDVLAYTITKTYGAENPAATAIHATLNDANASAIVMDAINNVFSVEVTAEDGTTSQTYTITVVEAAAKKALLRATFSNGVHGFIANGNIDVPYIAGEAVPTFVGATFWQADGEPTAEVVGSNLVVTGIDSQTDTYTITYVPLTPAAACNEEIIFDGVPSYVHSVYGWDENKGLKFSKDVEEASNHRISEGKDRIYMALPAAQNFTLTGGSAGSRPVEVVVNGHIVQMDTKTPKSGETFSFDLDPTKANLVGIESRGNNGDAGFTKLFVQAPFPTAIENSEVEMKAVKVVRNGQLFIEKNGVLYNAQGAIVK